MRFFSAANSFQATCCAAYFTTRALRGTSGPIVSIPVRPISRATTAAAAAAAATAAGTSPVDLGATSGGRRGLAAWECRSERVDSAVGGEVRKQGLLLFVEFVRLCLQRSPRREGVPGVGEYRVLVLDKVHTLGQHVGDSGGVHV